MKYKLVQYKEDMYRQQWTIPLLMALLGVTLAAGTLFLDYQFPWQDLMTSMQAYINEKGASQALSIIASSVITITSVTFSITILTLSMQSSQLGPRLLPNFMAQKATQLVLGIFIGTFIYCLIVLQSVVNFSDGVIPYISILTGFSLGIISFFVLIYFIHFVCYVIDIDNVLDFLTKNLIASLERQLPERHQGEHKIDKVINNAEKNQNSLGDYNEKTPVDSKKWGYVQTIDYEYLYDLAKKNNFVINVDVGLGKFVFTSAKLMTVLSQQPIDDSIIRDCLSAFHIGKRRSTVQDIEFAFEELSEIALRALSPGINNPYTAIHCIDKMSEGFSVLAGREMLSNIMCDDDGHVYLMRNMSGYSDIVETALNRLRQQAEQDLSVTIYMITMISRLLELDLPYELSLALKKQANELYNAVIKQDLQKTDKEDLEYYYNRIT